MTYDTVKEGLRYGVAFRRKCWRKGFYIQMLDDVVYGCVIENGILEKDIFSFMQADYFETDWQIHYTKEETEYTELNTAIQVLEANSDRLERLDEQDSEDGINKYVKALKTAIRVLKKELHVIRQ